MISKFIQALRKKHHLSQEEVASQLEISRPTYALIESGQKDPTMTEVKKLADIFNISLHDFIHQNLSSVSVKIEKQNKIFKKEKSPIRISIPQERVDKFTEILLYILKKVGGKPNVGMTVLYKLLYFIDFDYYEKYEEQLIGLVYIKNHFGPTPLLFDEVIQNLVKKEHLEIIKSKFYKYPQTKYLLNPSLEPNLSILNGQEMEFIEWELQRLSDMTANQLSDLSHKDIPWISTENGKPLDYESVFYRTAETSIRTYDDSEESY